MFYTACYHHLLHTITIFMVRTLVMLYHKLLVHMICEILSITWFIIALALLVELNNHHSSHVPAIYCWLPIRVTYLMKTLIGFWRCTSPFIFNEMMISLHCLGVFYSLSLYVILTFHELVLPACCFGPVLARFFIISIICINIKYIHTWVIVTLVYLTVYSVYTLHNLSG